MKAAHGLTARGTQASRKATPGKLLALPEALRLGQSLQEKPLYPGVFSVGVLSLI
jgi:hypothetical protein